MTHQLPKLTYDYDALEPHIDRLTMEIHYTKHHAGYVANLNNLIEANNELKKLTAEELLAQSQNIPSEIRQGVINNAGGHVNHSMFWEIMAPNNLGGGGSPIGKTAQSIDSAFGNFNNFKEEFTKSAMSVFGSGWVFLIIEHGKLILKRHSFQNSPFLYDTMPIMGIDVWEHAYYLKYQNKRADYIKNWFNVVKWEEVEKRFHKVDK